MKIWLLNPYGPMPDEGWRKYRHILLGETLVSDGHEVAWFASRFSHHFKKFRKGSGYITNTSNFSVSYIETTSYKNNIGIGRIIFEISYCLNAYLKLRNLDPPDFIIAADPPQFVGMLARRLAKKKSAYLILDLGDEWPELFERAAPKKFKVLIPLLVGFFKALRKKNYSSADGVLALGANYYKLAKSLATNTAHGALIYNGVDGEEFVKWAKETEVASLIPQKNDNDIWCIYAGSLGIHGDNYDLGAIVTAAMHFSKTDETIKFIVAGAGAGREWILKMKSKENLDNLFFLENLMPEQLAAVYAKCDIGMAVYGAGSNVDMPDKFYDYSTSGLAIVSSLTSEVADLIEVEKIGVNYKANDHNDFIKKLNVFVVDREKLSEFKARSRKVGKVFDQKNQYKKLHSLIREIKNT
jgi:glycosyltransferase involved in cell wall biosynthesis